MKKVNVDHEANKAKELMEDMEAAAGKKIKSNLKAGAGGCAPGSCQQPLYGVVTATM